MNQTLSDILVTTNRLILNIQGISTYFERKYYNFLVFKEGVYKYGQDDPCLIPSIPYFIRNKKDKNKHTPFVSFDDVQEGDYIVDINANVKINENELLNRNTYLSNRPTTTTVGYKIVCFLIDYYILRQNNFLNTQAYSCLNRLKQLFVESFNFDEIERMVEDDAFRPLLRTIDDFICKDINHVYFIKKVSITDLIVEKTVDWRVMDWELNMNKQHE